jgi:hypothetical protein
VTASGRKAEATKGPWIIWEAPGSKWDVGNCEGAVAEYIASESDARLIAEAPAMREALAEWVSHEESYVCGCAGCERMFEKSKAILARVGGK